MYSLRTLLLCLIAGTFFASGCVKRPDDATSAAPMLLDVQLIEVLTLGADESAPPELLFGNPNFVVTDSQGHIFVADQATMGVKVYDEEGQYLRTIGQRGRGPGEMLYINCMYLDSNDHLIIADQLNARITRFTLNGEVLSTHPLDVNRVLWPRQIRETENNHYLAQYKLPIAADLYNDKLLHLLDKTFQVVEEFISFDELDYAEDAFADAYYAFNTGHFEITRAGHVIYVPSLYTGDLFQYQNQNGTWVKTKKLKGYVARKKAFTRLDDPENRPSNAVSIRAGFNHYAGIVHNESLGIFEMQDGNLVHFTVIQFDDRRVFGVELFDPAGTLVGYGTLTGFEMPEDAQRLPITVSWKDQQDRFYLIDYFGYPVVRVVKLAYKPATGQRAGQAAGA